MGGFSEAPAARPLSEDALVEFARERESNPVERPGASRLLAVGFLAVAVAALFLPGNRSASAVAIVVSLLAYAIARQVEIEFTTFYLVPTEAIFVVMWFVLPLRELPLVVCAAMLLGDLPAVRRRRAPLERTIVLNVAASWFAIGPALVLYLAGANEPRWRDLPIYAAALLAQFVFDFVTTLLLQRTAVGAVSVPDHLRAISAAASYDLMLAPVGLLAAFPAYRHPVAILLLVPMLVIVQRIAAEREARHTHELELKTAYQGTSYLLGDVIESDDEYTGSHSREVVQLVLEVSSRLGLDSDELRIAEFTALLHDVGKVKIPAAVLNKPGQLDADERALMDTHTILGEEMLQPIGGLLGRVGRIVRSCHERWDGTGYPDGLAGKEIPLVARIVAACDAWSAMTSDRPYRPALTRAEAAGELRRATGTQFDPTVAAVLSSVLDL
jgi:HD-GYP domain-containing protein (c-di-GMP phosphodiesterase class II)